MSNNVVIATLHRINGENILGDNLVLSDLTNSGILTNLSDSCINTALALTHLAYSGILPDLANYAVNSCFLISVPSFYQSRDQLASFILSYLTYSSVLTYLADSGIDTLHYQPLPSRSMMEHIPRLLCPTCPTVAS